MGTMSRFRIHDEESAPVGSQPILKGAVLVLAVFADMYFKRNR